MLATPDRLRKMIIQAKGGIRLEPTFDGDVAGAVGIGGARS